jgi:outer membrane translocation and assembly module TamA
VAGLVLGYSFLPLLLALSWAAAAEPVASIDLLSQHQFENFCAHIWTEKDFKLRLAPTERRLVCGDDKDDQTGRPWKHIPPNQARYFLKVFLQQQGFHQAEFQQVKENLYIIPGPRSRLTDFTLLGKPEGWDAPRKRQIKGNELTPKLLDELEGWTKFQIKNIGYACGTAQALAQPSTGIVEVQITPAKRLKILAVVDIKETGLAPGVLDRYDAFHVGPDTEQYYSEMLVQLTKRRVVDDGVVQTINISNDCREDGVILQRETILGTSRQVKVGFGASVEELASISLNATQARLWSSASSAQFNASASLRMQLANARLRWYYSDTFSRYYLEPSVSWLHRLETLYENETTEVKLLHSWNWEFTPSSLTLKVGPDYQSIFQERGDGPARVTLNLLETDLNWMSHAFEFYKSSPRSGFSVDMSLLHAQRFVGSDFSADRLISSGEYLVNLGNWDPPLAILAMRWMAGTSFLADSQTSDSVPTLFRFFAGGDADLRGFDRQSLPQSGMGSLSKVVASFELRFFQAIFRMVDPFLFADVGRVGDANFTLRAPTFYSPGFGLRYQSAIGTFRAYAARGMLQGVASEIQGLPEHWRFGLTFGEEF